jgi:glycosyltransferase involved in cell wall biosynthesis
VLVDDDAALLAAAIERVVADEPTRAALAAAGPARAAGFTWARAAALLREAYRDAVEAGAR